MCWLRAVLLLSSALVGAAQSQQLEARISVTSVAPPRVRVDGARKEGATAWSFRSAHAGVSGLGERIENLTLADANGADVPVRRLAPGEYEASRPAVRFSYGLKLDPPLASNDTAHVSWLAAEQGLLLPGDLLPVPTTGSRLQFVLPSNWNIATAETANARGQFETTDSESSVFFVGRDLRERRIRQDSMSLTFISTGAWAFSDEEAANGAAEIVKAHAKILGGAPRSRAVLLLAPFPRPAAAHHWSAETRGGTVILFSGRSPSKAAGLAQLSVPLAHETLHLWIPNGLSLDGDYDWFYEGFTMYQALRVQMRLGQLSFQDYLGAMGRAFDNYRAAQTTPELSLLEASRRRWSSGSASVYHKGMLVAFLYDLRLRQQTGGKHSLDDVYRELFRRHHAARVKSDGNAAVIGILNEIGGMQSFTERHIGNAQRIDLLSSIAPYGLDVAPGGVRTRVVVAASLSRTQRDLLRKLGYTDNAGVTSRRPRESLK